MAKPIKKCANPSCNCQAAAGSKYCGAHCEDTLGRTELMCLCGHSNCLGETRTAESAPTLTAEQ